MTISTKCSADVGQDDVGLAVGVEVADDQVGEAGLGPVRLVAGERLEPLALAAGQDDAEPVGAGQEQVVAAVAVEVGDVHPLEVDRADRERAAGPVDAVLLVEEEERLGGPVEQDDLLDAVAVGVERRGAEDLGRASAGVVLVLDLPVAVLVEQEVAGERVLGDDQRRAVRGRSGSGRPGVTPASGPRLPPAGAGGSPGAAEQQERRAVRR